MDSMNRILDKFRRQCSRREYCSSDIFKKALKDLEGDVEKASLAVQTLIEEKYVDDRRYAEAYAREKSSISGWGEVKIRYALSARGLPAETISAALSAIDVRGAGLRMEKLLDNKYRTLKDDPRWKLKIIRFALGRGYSYEQVQDYISRLSSK